MTPVKFEAMSCAAASAAATLEQTCIRHIASAAELWFMGPGFPDALTAQEVARCGPPAADRQNRTLLAEFKRIPSGRARSLKSRGVQKTMPFRLRTLALAALAAFLLVPGTAALAGLGQPSPWQIGFQDSGSPVMEDVAAFHTFVMWIITGIVVFVLALLVIIMVRFNANANPTPSRTTHNTLIEVAWTVIPVVILLVIAVPSFRLLFYQLNTPPADLTVKVTGVTWNWKYDYPDNGDFEYDSLILPDKDLKPGQPRLLTVDNEMVVPVNKVVRLLVTGFDVIHSFAVPSFGIKIDAIPGRLNETWFQATREGWYYGQCTELCGKDHAFMPIAIHAVSEQDFSTWVQQAKEKYAAAGAPTKVAVTPAAAVPNQRIALNPR
jgi:cytochrome c oxidase subunit II